MCGVCGVCKVQSCRACVGYCMCTCAWHCMCTLCHAHTRTHNISHKPINISPINTNTHTHTCVHKHTQIPTYLGRLDDVLKRCSFLDTKRFEVLTLDEADRLLDMGFRKQLDSIMMRLPRQRRTGVLRRGSGYFIIVDVGFWKVWLWGGVVVGRCACVNGRGRGGVRVCVWRCVCFCCGRGGYAHIDPIHHHHVHQPNTPPSHPQTTHPPLHHSPRFVFCNTNRSSRGPCSCWVTQPCACQCGGDTHCEEGGPWEKQGGWCGGGCCGAENTIDIGFEGVFVLVGGGGRL